MNHAFEKPADRLLFVLALLLVFMMSARAPVDTDMYWALRVGKEIVESRAFIHTDPITYTHAGQPWVSHSWLFDVVLYGMYNWLHYHGLTLLVALLAAVTMAILWFQLTGSAAFRTLMIVFAGLIAAPTWTPRPQMISMLLLCLTYLILFLYRRAKDRRLLLILPPMMILWANLHGGYILGLVAIGTLIAGEIVDHLLFNNTQDNLSWLQIRDLGILLVVCLLFTLITPYGFGTWEITFSTFNMNANEIISEWQSPNFHQSVVFPYFLSILMLVGMLALSKQKRSAWDMMTLVVFLYFSLSSRRQIGVYAVAVVPILGRGLWDLLVEWWKTFETYLKDQKEKLWLWFNKITAARQAKEHKWVNLLVVALFAAACWGKLLYVSMPYLVEEVLNPTVFPVAAVQKLQELAQDGQLFNEYGWGGYHSWFAPEIPVYIDARADLFGDEFIFHWDQVCLNQADWRAEFEKWGITNVLIMADCPLAQELQYDDAWQLIFEDEISVLYVKTPNINND